MKSKKSFKGKLIKLVIKNLCKTEFARISGTTLQEHLDKYLSFKTEVSNFSNEETFTLGNRTMSGQIKFAYKDDKIRIIDFHVALNEPIKFK